MSVTSTVPIHWTQTGSGMTDYDLPRFQIVSLYSRNTVEMMDSKGDVKSRMWAAKESQREFLRRKKK